MQKKCIVFIHAKGFVPWDIQTPEEEEEGFTNCDGSVITVWPEIFFTKKYEVFTYIDCVEKTVPQSVNQPTTRPARIFISSSTFFIFILW